VPRVSSATGCAADHPRDGILKSRRTRPSRGCSSEHLARRLPIVSMMHEISARQSQPLERLEFLAVSVRTTISLSTSAQNLRAASFNQNRDCNRAPSSGTIPVSPCLPRVWIRWSEFFCKRSRRSREVRNDPSLRKRLLLTVKIIARSARRSAAVPEHRFAKSVILPRSECFDARNRHRSPRHGLCSSRSKPGRCTAW